VVLFSEPGKRARLKVAQPAVLAPGLPRVGVAVEVWLAFPAALRGEPRVRKLAEAIGQRFRDARTGSA
jgi:hypothetical protein